MFASRKTLLRRVSPLCALLALGATLPPGFHAQTPAPDNSAVNKGQQVTADQQSGHYSDRELTAKIRQSLMRDKELSVYGHNVKIVSQNGMVTLMGPVHSEEEKQAIAGRAATFAGQDKVVNQLTVKQ